MPWTTEQARQMANKGGQAFARLMAERRANGEIGRISAQPDYYLAKRLSRVRAQLDLVDAEIRRCAANPEDSKRLKELVDAQARLSDQEFDLAQRHKPGQLRPGQEKVRKTSPRLPDPQVEPPRDNSSVAPSQNQ